MNNNYFLKFFDIYYGPFHKDFSYNNKLYESTKNNFEWIAITIYDSTEHQKWRKRRCMTADSLKYYYLTYYNVNGLKSSLRNLYFKNKIPEPNYSNVMIIVANDYIIKVQNGGIYDEETYLKLKYTIDSLSNAQ